MPRIRRRGTPVEGAEPAFAPTHQPIDRSIARFHCPASSFRGDFDGREVTTLLSLVSALIARYHSDDEGQGLAEYALILALIAIVAIVALIFLGNQISGILRTVGQSV